MIGSLRFAATAALLLFLNALTATAAESLRIAADIEDERATFDVRPAGLSGSVIDLDVPAVGLNSLELGGNQYQEVKLPLADKLFDGETAVEGEPAVPALSTFLAVPDQAGISFSVEYSGFEIIEDIDLAPSQPSAPESGMEQPPFTISNEVYMRDEFYPGQLGEVTDPMIMRDVRVVQVSMYPVQYNPVRRQLKVYRDLNVSVSYDGSEIVNPKTTRSEYLSDGFYPIYRATIANFDQFFSTPEVRRGGYLILAKDLFVNSLEELANWKRRKGYTVHIAPTSEIDPNGDSPTQTEVFNYIDSAYTHWEVPPEYVMIVGDESGSYSIPDWPYSYYTSDHHYTLVEGSDYLPDLFVSRLSVTSQTQLNVALAKILDYETNPYMEDPNHWRRGLSVAGNVYATTPRITVLWVRHLLLHNGFTHVDTSFGWYSGDTDPYLLGYFNAGPCFVSYRGWAGPSGWYSPSFGTSNLNSIQNHNKLAVMASIVCGTGEFGYDECFGEKWIRMGSSTTSYKGGPVFFGSTDTSTHTKWNNPILTGFYWGIFSEDIYHFAAAAVRGKLLQYATFPRYNSPGGTVEQYFHTYNMLGDPELEIRTTPPVIINVAHPQTLNVGINHIDIHVTGILGAPVEGAYVTLYKELFNNEQVYERDMTDENGNVSIHFEGATIGDMMVTVSGRNLFPHQGTVSIVNDQVAVAYVSHSIDDDNSGYSSGNGDGVANPGETIELSVALKNFSMDQSVSGIQAEIVPVDQDIATVYDSQQAYGDIGPGESSLPETPFVVRISPAAQDGDIVLLRIIASDGENSWQSSAALPVEAPKFIVTDVDFPGGNGRLDPGETLDMILTIENAGSVDATGVSGIATTGDDYTTVISDSGNFGDIPAGGSADNAGSSMVVMSDISTFDGRTINFNLNLATTSGVNTVIPFTTTVGLMQSADPAGPDAYGYYMFDNTDAGYDHRPTYDWVEIVPNLGGQGTRIYFSGGNDDNSELVTLPFEFIYYGESYGDIIVCTNGFVAPDTSTFDMGGNYWYNFFNWPIPDPGNARGQISPFWDDLTFSGSTYGVYTWHDAENHRFVVEWYHMNHRNTSAIETFELIITDPAYHPTLTGDSEIFFQYSSIINNDSGENYSSVGFESFNELMGLEYTYDNFYDPGAATLSSGRAIKITTNTGRGAVKGNVDLSDSESNQGVRVSASTGQYRLTPESGDYWIREIPVGMIDVTASADGYFPSITADVNVVADVTGEAVDFTLARCPKAENLAASEGLGDRIELTWDAVVHDDLVGYNVYRAAWENGDFQMLNEEPVSGESFTDNEVPDNDVYWYYVTAVFSGDYGDAESFGSEKDYGSLDVVTGIDDERISIPDNFFLSQNYPNPFNPSTTLSYGLSADSDVLIRIYNVLGQNVRTLVDEHQTAGFKFVIWDGSDDSGNKVSTGVYFYTIEAGRYHDSRKMLLIK